MNLSAGEVALSISTPGANVPRPALLPAPTGYVSTGGSPTATLVRKVQPGYPPLAMQARIQGVVKLKAIIAKDGSVQNVTVVSAHPLLAQAAIDAVKQWVYQPTLVNGQPVEVSTQIDINFALADEPPAQQ
jgi:protein TonB